MRIRSLIRICALVVGAGACRSSIEVRTMAAPDAGLSTLHTFRMLAGPARRDGRAPTGADDPMIANSIANRAIREQLRKAFEERGYVVNDGAADFAVAFYATAREKLDATLWDYGYPFYPGFPPHAAPPPVTRYTEGPVVVDVVRPGSRALLWRGEGRAELSDDPAQNVAQLAKAATAIVAKFPKALPRTVAVR